jgi:hypothetical protein
MADAIVSSSNGINPRYVAALMALMDDAEQVISEVIAEAIQRERSTL